MTKRSLLSLLTLLWLSGCGGSDAQVKETDPSQQEQQLLAALEQEEKAVGEAVLDVPEPAVPEESVPTVEATHGGSTAPGHRRWKDASGRVVVIGEFVSLAGENVCIETPDGGGAVVRLADLSLDDQAFVESASGGLDLNSIKKDEPVEQIADAAVASVDSLPQSSHGAESYEREKVVIPFDFVSKFDDGRYGSMVGDMLWKKLDKEGGVIIPEAMQDVRGICEASGLAIGPDTPLEEVGRAVKKYFDADVAIWGSVERVPPNDWDVYDVTIRCADFSVSPPRVIYEAIDVRTETVSEIPHLYVKQMLDRLYDRPADGSVPVNATAEANWANNPNLVPGGDFQKGSGGVPFGWESTGGQMREPLGDLVRWVDDTTDSYSRNKVIRFTFDKGVGNGYGVMYYSKPFPIEEGATYRFQCRYRTNGPNVKVFIKCYDVTESRFNTGDDDVNSATAALKASGDAGYDLEGKAFYECYRSQQNLKGPKNQWNTQTEDFTPRHTKYTPRFGRVDLYAYLGAGVVEFDDVLLKQILPPSAGESKTPRRHSLDTRVTLEEMQENEDRARQPQEDNE